MVPLFDQRNLQMPSLLQGPALNISALTQLDRALPIRGFAIKYVLEGTERYTVNGMPFPIGADQYLLANRFVENRVTIDSALPVRGLCIELTTAVLDEVVQAWATPEALDEGCSTSFFTGAEFPESRNDAQRTSLGPMLRELATAFFRRPHAAQHAGRGLYYQLAERVVQDHLAMIPRLRAVRAARPATRKLIYQRVQRAKAFMDSRFTDSLDVADMAREAAMSEYHFFRAFRAVEGITPHRYVQQRRLEFARHLLLSGHASVLEAALGSGFADAPSFSKSFRKAYGHAPSALLRRSSRI